MVIAECAVKGSSRVQIRNVCGVTTFEVLGFLASRASDSKYPKFVQKVVTRTAGWCEQCAPFWCEFTRNCNFVQEFLDTLGFGRYYPFLPSLGGLQR